jgi:hypothetical protein
MVPFDPCSSPRSWSSTPGADQDRTADRSGPGLVPDLERRDLDAIMRLLSHEPCPDCSATARGVEIEPRVTVLQILHDPTCPAFRAREENR